MDYSSLKSNISDWLARSDVSASADSFIDLAEARINRELRIRAMESPYFRALDSDAKAPVPSDYRAWKTAFLYKGTGTDDVLPDLSEELVFPLNATQGRGAYGKRAYGATDGGDLTRIGDNFYVSGHPDGTYSLGGIYYASFAALSAGNTTNWLTDNAPDLLLSAGLSEAAAYIKNESEMAYWSQRFSSLLGQVQAESDRELWSGEKIVTRSGVRCA